MENAQEESRGNQSNWSFPFHRHTHTCKDHFKAFGVQNLSPLELLWRLTYPSCFISRIKEGSIVLQHYTLRFLKKQIRVLL